MGVERQLVSPGNGADYPKKGDTVTIEYTGVLEDPHAHDRKGKQYVINSILISPSLTLLG